MVNNPQVFLSNDETSFVSFTHGHSRCHRSASQLHVKNSRMIRPGSGIASLFTLGRVPTCRDSNGPPRSHKTNPDRALGTVRGEGRWSPATLAHHLRSTQKPRAMKVLVIATLLVISAVISLIAGIRSRIRIRIRIRKMLAEHVEFGLQCAIERAQVKRFFGETQILRPSLEDALLNPTSGLRKAGLKPLKTREPVERSSSRHSGTTHKSLSRRPRSHRAHPSSESEGTSSTRAGPTSPPPGVSRSISRNNPSSAPPPNAFVRDAASLASRVPGNALAACA